MKAQPVEFRLEDVGDLGNAGWHTKAIANATGLSPSQVLYRLKQANVKRRDYRNGDNEMAHIILKIVRARGDDRKEMSASASLFLELENLHITYVASVLKNKKAKKLKGIFG